MCIRDRYSAVVVTSKNRPGILKDIVSGFTHSQSNILSSRIISLNNNQVIDVFWVTNFLNKGVLDLNEQKRAAKHVMNALDKRDLKPLKMLSKDKHKLVVNPQITIDNNMSKQVTTFQILSGDRPGLLMDILGVFHNKQISVQSAKISTYGEKVFDIFQLTNSNNQKIKDENLLKSIEKDLMSIF